jgi:hypothetical protein
VDALAHHGIIKLIVHDTLDGQSCKITWDKLLTIRKEELLSLQANLNQEVAQ